jgi:hypothetical protein
MTTLESIESAILQLPNEQLTQLTNWLLDLDYQRWDKQLEQDIADGRLEHIALKALNEFENGLYKQI